MSVVAAAAAAAAPPCPICHASSVPAYAAAEYRMYRCVGCRTAFVHRVPSDEQLARFYAGYHLSDVEGGQYDQVEDRMRSDFPSKLQRVRAVLDNRQGMRLLDVGCGKGYFVKACVDGGIDAHGIDLSSSGVKYATETLGVKATCGSVESSAEALGTFDVVTFWATIEHLPDPIRTLRSIRELLKPGGALFVDTGIGNDWLDRALPGVVQWYDPPQHLFVFSAAGLSAALRAAGFEVIAHEPCFERSRARKAARLARAAAVATALRAAAVAGRMRSGEWEFTRFPRGNLQLAVARRAN